MRPPFVHFLVASGLASIGCNAILHNDVHELAPQVSSDEGGMEAGLPADGNTAADVRPQAETGGPDVQAVAVGPDAEADAGTSSEAGLEGPTAPCANDASVCVTGGISSMGSAPANGDTGTLPNGSTVALTEDGFELAATTCDTTGMTCVTGAIAP